MSLDYSLAKCNESFNTNGKVADKYGAETLYSLTMAMMAAGVPELKTAIHCETLFDRINALGWIGDGSARQNWWNVITDLQGLTTNANKKTDAQFAKQLLDKMKRDGEMLRRRMVKGENVNIG
jgi:predicted acyl esterase